MATNQSNKSRTRYPIESFGPELMTALVRGSREPIVLELKTWKAAVKMAQRLHMLRARMREDNHTMYNVVSRAHVSVMWGTKAGYKLVDEVSSSKGVRRPKDTSVPAKLIVRPRDSEYADVLKNAGIEVDSEFTKTVLPPGTAPSTSEELLDEIFRESEKKEKSAGG